MEKIIISLTNIPNNPEEDYNKKVTKWVNGRMISFDEGPFINYYIHHEDNTVADIDGNEKISTDAYQIRVEKPVTQEKIITAVEKDAYRLYSNQDFLDFQAKLVRDLQENPNSEFVVEHTKLLRWVKNGLNIAKGITKEEAKEMILQEIIDYDKSIAVNSFILNGFPAWLDKDTRVGLMNSITIEKQSGLEYTTLWLGTMVFTLPVDTAIEFLFQLELYAKECYNRTAEHKFNLERLELPEEILEYNYKEGYPEKLVITI